ncbi:MAG: CDP-glucose 4,6-dehydratase [Vicinamibacterales bacterium]
MSQAQASFSAFRGRRVLVTGHTGFKGGWLTLWLTRLGAHVTGLSLPPEDDRIFFRACGVASRVEHVEGDLTDLGVVEDVWRRARPEVVFHLAAQSLVRESYRLPHETMAANVMGTVNVLEAARRCGEPAGLVLVTTDKCYENRESGQPFRETDRLGGHDPYSGSKAAAEILIESYRQSFWSTGRPVSVSSVRAGNVIGGGDWARDRIIPDAVRALADGEPILVRNPGAVRPWQHVLEPLSGYLAVGAGLWRQATGGQQDFRADQAWNFGPRGDDERRVQELVDRFVAVWGSGASRDVSDPAQPHEAGVLRLDSSKATALLGWAPRWGIDEALAHTAAWYRDWQAGTEMSGTTLMQIAAYERSMGKA